MRNLMMTTAACLTVATAASAQTDYSAMLRDDGIAATVEAMNARGISTPSDAFALGGAQFLLTIEHALQTRYNTAFNDDMLMGSNLPFLRLPIAMSNPAPQPFRPDLIAEVFETAVSDLAGAITPLTTIVDTDSVGVTINTADLWFDINSNGQRDTSEGMFEIVAPQLNPALLANFNAPKIRFDTSDAAWLSAYAHLLSGISETILSVDPTSAITRVTTSATELHAYNDGVLPSLITSDDTPWIDMAAMFIHAIEGQPDPALLQSAHGHFQSMIADNQTFWARVGTETDNKLEWIPNPDQQSALPIEFPENIGDTWRGVLAEAAAVLDGDLLIPHWRLGPNAGINLKTFVDNPPEIDIIAMLQGEGILPYAAHGPRMTGDTWGRFQRLMGGDAALFAVILN